MISNKCYYALKAMLELALREGQGPVTINDIAKAQQIPARFLEAILRELKQAGFAESLRGKEGGYFLAKPTKKISVGDVIRQFEGPLVSVNTTTKDVFSNVWKNAETALTDVFDKINFAELIEQEKERTSLNVVNYSI